MRILLVTGTRRTLNDNLISVIRNELASHKLKYDLLLVGDCKTGVDAWFRTNAHLIAHKCVMFEADWEMLGLKAGPIRNERMVKFAAGFISNPAKLPICEAFALVFPSVFGSSGTRDCIKALKRYKINYKEIEL